MKLRLACHEPGCPALIEYHPTGAGEEKLDCPRCNRRYVAHGTDRLVRGEKLTRCAMCRGEELFIRKNFPQKLGLLIVLSAAVVSFITLERSPGVAYAVLVAAVLIDVLIYGLIGIVTVCYRCRTEYWGLARNRDHDWFDLAASEKYR